MGYGALADVNERRPRTVGLLEGALQSLPVRGNDDRPGDRWRPVAFVIFARRWVVLPYVALDVLVPEVVGQPLRE